jgi:UDP-N-acetylglucosamine 2-epimerase
MVTVHRRENHGANIKSVAKAILNILQKHQDMVVVWPVHPNPKVKNAVYSAFAGVPADVTARLHLTEPLNYPVLLWMLKHSWTVLTDSGGIQEEAVALGTPVMVLRSTTERPEVIEVGAGLMVGTGTESIVSHVEKLLGNTEKYNAMCNAENPFGNGTAAASICDILIKDNFSERKYA